VFNQKYSASESKVRTKGSTTEPSPFNDLAPGYDPWFEREGKPAFAIEVTAFHEV